MRNALLHDPIIVFLAVLSIAYIVSRILVDAIEYVTEYDYDEMSKDTKLLKKLYYNHKYDLPRKLNHLEDIENHYIVVKHNICTMIETIITAIVNYHNVDGDVYAEVFIALIKIREIMERYLSEIIDNAPKYSTSDLRCIYFNAERFCEYMSNEWYLNDIREINTKVIRLEIECIPHFITLSKHIQTITSIDASGDLLKLMKKEIPLDDVA